MKRALFIASRDDLYGAPRALLAHLARLPAHGFELLALALPSNGPLAERARALGVEVLVEPAVGSSRSVVSRVTAAWRLRGLARFCTARGIERVVAATLSACPAAVRVAKMAGLRSVVHVRTLYRLRGKGDAFLRYGVPRADQAIFVSEAVLAEYREACGGTCPEGQSIAVVHDGIEAVAPMTRVEARARLGVPEEVRLAGAVGAVSERKRSPFAARVAHGAGLIFAAFGDGEVALEGEQLDARDPSRVRAALKMSEGKASAHPTVLRFGFLDDAARLLSAFDVCLHPSRDEAFGLAPLEAMAAGVPVIASNAAGLPESLGDAAVLLDPLDEAAWIEAARRLSTPGVEREAWVARGKERAVMMSADASARHVAEVYRAS